MVGYAFHYKKNSSSSSMENNNNKKEGGGDGGDGEGRRHPPPPPEWVEGLLKSEFFGECGEHRGLRKGDENFFCVDCIRRMCSHCLAPHKGHRCLQIRRYVYNDVVRIVDLQKLLDLSRIQPYIVNGFKVVHLNPRSRSSPSKSNSGAVPCEICRRNDGHPSRFCSLACKGFYVPLHAAAAAASDDNAASQSEPSIHDPTSDLDDNGNEKEVESSAQEEEEEQQPYDSGEENQGPRKQRRKGIPRRAPEY